MKGGQGTAGGSGPRMRLRRIVSFPHFCRVWGVAARLVGRQVRSQHIGDIPVAIRIVHA